MDKTLKSLYETKGELVTQLEIIQSRLGEVNKQIVQLLSQANGVTSNEPREESAHVS